MGEVVELVTGKTLVEDTHPADDLTKDVEVPDEQKHFYENARRAWDEAVQLLSYMQYRYDMDRDDAAILVVHSILTEAKQCQQVPEAAAVLDYIGRTFYDTPFVADPSSVPE